MTEAGNNPNCGTCEGTGRIEAYPDADIYAPCDECRPEDLKLWNAGYKAALADPDTVVVPREVVSEIKKIAFMGMDCEPNDGSKSHVLSWMRGWRSARNYAVRHAEKVLGLIEKKEG